MKLVSLLMLIGCLHVNAAVFSQKITLSEKGITYQRLFKKINKQTGYKFFYNDQLLRNAGPVDIHVENATIGEVLAQSLKEVPVTYLVIDKTIVIQPKADVPGQAASARKDVTGMVVDTAGNPLIGASVALKGTSLGAKTDPNGRFSINASPGDVLVISYVGHISREVRVTDASALTITLQTDPKGIEEVVVTALGIKRAAKALNYNLQEIKGEELTRNKDASFVNSLVGKVAGVTINASAAGIGGATRVVMRGPKSINFNNNALYVVDGIPMTNTGGALEGIFGGTTGSDNISSINPEDIESLSVLTGAAAAAQYGSLGQNGVVLITTRSAKAGKARLSYANNTTFFSPLVMPEFQNTYGQSDQGSYYSWGPKLKQPSSYKPENFFQTGTNVTHALNFSSGTEKNQLYVSGALMNTKGIVPNNNLTRYNFSARNTSKLLQDRMTLDVSLMYMRQKEQNMFAQGLYHSPIVPVYLFPPGANMKTYQTYERHDATRSFPTQFWPFSDDEFRMQNPYWIANRESFVNNIDRLFLTVGLKYELFDWLSLSGRAKLERNTTEQEVKMYAGTKQLFAGPGGRFSRGQGTGEQRYGELMANFNKSFKGFDMTGNLVFSRMDNINKSHGVDAYIPEGAVPNLFTTDNVAGTASSKEPTRTSYQALFGIAELSYKRKLFLTGSYRYDWWSQLYGTGRLYVAYPSIGASVILSDLLPITSNWLSYAKLRANYSEVGNPPPAYVTGIQTYPVSNGSPDFGSGVKPSPDLKPERTKGWEAGANLKFLRNRLNLDVTLYKTNTYNQIFNVPISSSSFYTSYYINAGQVNNEGIEAALGFNGKLGSVNWESNATFTLNRNKVVKLIRGYYDAESGLSVTRDTLDKGGSGSYAMKVRVGGGLGDIYTSSLALDEHKDVILPLGTNQRNFIYAGSNLPDYTIGFRNAFSYRNFNLGVVLFGRFGGVGVSATQAMLDAYGVSKTSAEARERGYVIVNKVPFANVQGFYTTMGNGVNGVLSQYVYSATNVRLKELSLGYTFPGRFFGNRIQALQVAVTGQNLFMFYNKVPFDPESTASTGTYYQGFDYFMQPSLRGFGFSAKVQL